MTAFAAESLQMIADVRDTFGVNVTLSKVVPGAIQPKTMVRAEVATSLAVKAVKRPIDEERLPAGPGRTLRLEAIFEIMASDITIGTPIPGWRIAEGTTLWTITEADLDAERQVYTLTARRGA